MARTGISTSHFQICHNMLDKVEGERVRERENACKPHIVQSTSTLISTSIVLFYEKEMHSPH